MAFAFSLQCGPPLKAKCEDASIDSDIQHSKDNHADKKLYLYLSTFSC